MRKVALKSPAEGGVNRTQTFNSTLAKNSVDTKPPITLSCYVRSLLQQSQKKGKDHDLQQTVSSLSKNDMIAKLQFLQKAHALSRGSKLLSTNTLKDFQMGESNPARQGSGRSAAQEKDRNGPLAERFYSTYSINRVTRPPCSPTSPERTSLAKKSSAQQFQLKGHSRKRTSWTSTTSASRVPTGQGLFSTSIRSKV